MATNPPPSKYTDIPSVVYHNLRAVHESRARRLNEHAPIARISDKDIFLMMPDHQKINWGRDQEAITAATLRAMMRHQNSTI
jgi:hypothetical protein